MNLQQKKQIEELQSKLIQGNFMLLEAVEKLPAEDKKFFAPKVEKFIAECRVGFNDAANGKLPENDPDDLPEEIFIGHGICETGPMAD